MIKTLYTLVFKSGLSLVKVSLCWLAISVKIIAITNTQEMVPLPNSRRAERDYVFNQEIMDSYLEQRRLRPRLVDRVLRLCSSCLIGCIDARSHNSQNHHRER